MNKPAFSASYADWKLIKTRRCIQIVLEIPLEKENEAYTVLGGMPRAGEETWCAVARLDLTTAQQPKENAHKQTSEPAPALPQTPARAHKSSPPQRCAILCNDPSFWAFLNKTYHQTMPAGCGVQDSEGAAALVRFLCDVKSRSEIIPGTPAFDKWDAILSRYVGWSAADQYVEVLSPTHWRTIEGPSE